MSEEHDHPHGEEGHHHWDFMAGEVDEDFLTQILEAHASNLAAGLRHLQAQMDEMQGQYDRCVAAIKARDSELDILEAANASNGTS